MLERTQEEQTTRETFNRLASFYNDLNPPHWKDENWIHLTSHIRPGGLILDLGCGTGRDGKQFLSDGFRYIGVDFSLPMLEAARPEVVKGKVSFCAMDMGKLGFTPESFDAFWSVSSFLHIPRAKLPKVLEQVYRVLKPGAVGGIYVPKGTYEGLYEGNDAHRVNGNYSALCVCWEPEPLKDVLVTVGFKILWCDYFPGSSMVMFAVRKGLI